MREPKPGDKYVIELSKCIDGLWKVKGFNALVFDQNGLDKIERIDETKAYREGLADAWKLINELSTLDDSKISKVFGRGLLGVLELDPSEAIAQWESSKKNKFKVGDEVIFNNRRQVIVYAGPYDVYHLVDGNFLRTVVQDKTGQRITPTGTHYDIGDLCNGLERPIS